jgi:hypothetical protein
MTTQTEDREALWDRLGDQLEADIRAAIDRVHAAMPEDPLNASGIVAIALEDLAEQFARY